MKAPHMILATALIALTVNGAMADSRSAAEKKSARIKKEADSSTLQTPTVGSYEKKIADMQKSIEQLRADIENIKAARGELQVKLEQSDKDIATQMKKIEEIKKKLAEKQQAAEALSKEKKQ